MIIDLQQLQLKKNKEKLEKIGNKAKSLIIMKDNKINVPDGFVLNTDLYNEFIKYNKIDKKINEFLFELNKKNIKNISKKIILLFEDLKFSSKIEKEIKLKLDNNKKYAIRSSGNKEDLEDYSFAGQYESFLSVDFNDVLNKVIDCYKSMFSENILSYYLDNNIDLKNISMAVIVQEMIDTEYSGIAFTINPITGNDKEMLIEVAEGLGENIVSGKVVPEQYYFNWYDNKYLYNENNKFLNKKIFKEITDIFLSIQILFGHPCDIEFGILKEKVYIFQARKITKLKYLRLEDIWSTADFKDGGISATISTQYMWSLYEYVWEIILRKYILDSKLLTKKEMNKKLGNMFYSRGYWNMSVVKLAMSKVIGYKEKNFDNEYGIIGNYEGDGETTGISLKSIIHVIKMIIAQNKILKIRDKNVEKYITELLDKYEKYKLDYMNNNISNIKETWYHLIKVDYLESESIYFWQIFINTVQQALYKEKLFKYINESEYLILLSNIENISHLRPSYEMWDISRIIRKNKNEKRYWLNTDLNLIVKDINKYNSNKEKNKKSKNVKNSKNNKNNEDRNEIFTKINKLIDEYGYHSDKELDITYKCYYEDITQFISNIKDLVLLEDKFSPFNNQEKMKIEYNKVLVKIKEKYGKRKYLQIKKIINRMREMLWWREEFKDISTRFYYIIRIYTLELAKTLVKENILKEIDDIWFLKIEDIWDFLNNNITKNELLLKISKNKVYYNSYRNYISENEIGNFNKINNKSNESNKIDDNKIIKGLGGNSGIAIGTARVIKDFNEIDRLEENDILITKFTDTGWTTKFAILSGIVTEFGGVLCHATIVSREYGIPAIVNCPDVMKKIKDGQKIKIDGATGIINILE